MSFSVIAIFLLLQVVHDVTSKPASLNFNATNCKAGEFFANNSGLCQRCRSADTHVNEVALEPCTKFKDAVIGCKENYFRKKQAPAPKESPDLQFACTRCGVCDAHLDPYRLYEIKPCSNDTNTICCHEANMIVVNDQCVTPTPTTSLPTDQTTVKPKTNSSMSTTDPPTRTTDPTTRTTEPTTRTTEPTTRTTEPTTRTTEPTTRTTEPTTRTTDPTTRTTDPPMRTTDPTTRTTDPPMRTTDPNMRTTELSTSHPKNDCQINSANSALLVFVLLLFLFMVIFLRNT